MYNFENKYRAIHKIWALSAVVLISSCAAKPPQETGAFKPSDLVELQRLDPTIQLDIRYATSKNLVGRPVYTEARAFLQRPAAEALARVNKELEPLGYRLLIFDGYRPWSVTKVFWDITPKGKREFVANPKKGSRHNRGCAVDLSLWDIAAAKEVQMTGEYDEMSPRSYANYPGGTPAQRALRDLLRSKMEQNGFAVLEAEWWHFDYQDWKSYRIQNVPFNKI
ncbi:M15 family metallopeptidase [Hymenobacter sp. BT770]|uniref:M15 family metallopeptidase n=1 Tax=Hymenobacter sp. BT770 TaxID=2886942 RepID=UPI001D0FCBEA|nr:M15 family metallopeptidase [Hymenobacter sp. BT770]MCC3151525.1 M15 family metallopeptidase [Hymenobacter sp. BT770]MDO3413899.1 M15 family metallopeptidase [Hymenobacter sp. BT770]